MSANWDDLDIVSQPLLSAQDFAGRASNWLEKVDASKGGREMAVMVHFAGVKESVSGAGIDWQTVVEGAAHRYVFILVNASCAGPLGKQLISICQSRSVVCFWFNLLGFSQARRSSTVFGYSRESTSKHCS